MDTLYTVGYQGLKVEELHDTVAIMDAVLADIRFSPRSKDAAWSGKNLEKVFGVRYYHIKALGNRNYKGDYGPGIILEDPESGCRSVLELLVQRPVVLMCACWNVETCHRKVAAEVIAKASGLPDFEIVHYTKNQVRDVSNRAQQIDLF